MNTVGGPNMMHWRIAETGQERVKAQISESNIPSINTQTMTVFRSGEKELQSFRMMSSND
jgi:hypothetical protein